MPAATDSAHMELGGGSRNALNKKSSKIGKKKKLNSKSKQKYDGL